MTKIYFVASALAFLIGPILFLTGFSYGASARDYPYQTINLLISSALSKMSPDNFVLFNQIISSFEVILALAVMGLFCFFLKRKDKKSAYLILVSGLSWFVVQVLKLYFRQSCPRAFGIEELYLVRFLTGESSRFCYPSSHVFNYVVILGIIMFLREKISSRRFIRELIVVFSLFLIFTIGISRLVLGAHFLTDVVGGYIFGFGWLLILIAIFGFK